MNVVYICVVVLVNNGNTDDAPSEFRVLDLTSFLVHLPERPERHEHQYQASLFFSVQLMTGIRPMLNCSWSLARKTWWSPGACESREWRRLRLD